jgi:hypothetical protein
MRQYAFIQREDFSSREPTDEEIETLAKVIDPYAFDTTKHHGDDRGVFMKMQIDARDRAKKQLLAGAKR